MPFRLRAVFWISLWLVGATARADPPVDRWDRSDVVRYYHEVFEGAADYDDYHGWTGSVAGCDAGTLSPELHAATIGRVNYFRAMAGLPADITLSEELNAKCQQAALMMSRNNAVSHTPSPSWHCYTPGAAEAAWVSNLSLGIGRPHYGPDAVLGQMEDDGDTNIGVSHRRWILWTGAPDEMGHGSIPLSPIVGDPSRQNASMVLWVSGPSSQELPAGLEFVAWPPAGFVPYEFAFTRWSFAIPGADFADASVSVGTAAGTLPVSVVHRNGSAGDRAIVFEPSGFPLGAPPTGDTTYTVTVSGISGAPESSYSYEVTLIDPDRMPPIEVSGGPAAYVGHPSRFGFTPLQAADSYQMRVFETSTGDWVAGAETGDGVIDGTRGDHALRTASFAHGGSRSFHLVWDGESFELDRTILPTATSELRFQQRFRWVGNTTSLIAEVADSSGAWVEIWRRTGNLQGSANSGHWDQRWNPVSIPLDEFAGETLRIRFRYHRDAGGYGWFPEFAGDQFHEFGALVDDIDVTDDTQIASETTTTLAAGSGYGEFIPPVAGTYNVQLRPQIAGIWFGYSPPLTVQAQVGTPPEPRVELVSVGIDATGAFYIEAETANLTSLVVQSSTDGTNWTTDDRFSLPSINGTVRATSTSSAGGGKTFRLLGN